MSKVGKPTYEELERRFQSYCKHDGGRRFDGESDAICAISPSSTTERSNYANVLPEQSAPPCFLEVNNDQ